VSEDYDPVGIVREIRMRISEVFQDDLHRYCEYLRSIEQTFPNPVYRRPEPEAIRETPTG
jgi:hypothetical protein